MKKLIFIVLLSISFGLSAQSFRTQIFNPSIKTLQIAKPGEQFGLPIIEMNGSDVIQVSFDEMSHEAHSYGYKVIHCNADWTPSSLNPTEYISSYTSANITDYTTSLNTSFLYTHYKFKLPNDDMGFKISGNYAVIIYEDNQTDKPIAIACFCLVEPHINISATVRGNTDTELSGRLQQLDFDLGLSGYTVRDANSEIKVVVRQNNRIDNQVTDLKPTFISGSKLSFINNRALIFDGGYEYHRFDISSVYAAGAGIERVRYKQPNYEAFLYPDKVRPLKSYFQEQDVNGKFVVHLQKSDDDDVEADYMNVHFKLQAPQPFLDGLVYIGGELNYNLLNDNSRMKYDETEGCYFYDGFLKQGGYNYQYWFVPKGQQKASVERIEGSFWQTRNEYTIYVYHRPWGERYDKLVGVKTVE